VETIYGIFHEGACLNNITWYHSYRERQKVLNTFPRDQKINFLLAEKRNGVLSVSLNSFQQQLLLNSVKCKGCKVEDNIR